MAGPFVDGAAAVGDRAQWLLHRLTAPLLAAAGRLPTRRLVALRDLIADRVAGLPTWAGYLLAVAAGTLLMVLRQIDSALRQMHRAVTFDADGGLFDNSGALTALEAWRALAPAAANEERPDSCVVPIFVQIDNGVGTAAGTGPDRRPAELLAPATALLGEIGSRQTHARNSAATAFSPPVSPGGREVNVDGERPDRLWFHISLFGQPGPEPPLGWTLAESTVGDMRAQLGAGPNQAEIAELRRILTTNLTCT